VDAPRLCDAIAAAARRHPICEAAIVNQGGVPRLVLGRHRVCPRTHDLTAMSSHSRERWLRECASRPFDLAEEAPLRADLVRHGADTWSLLLTWHHIAVDTWSTRIFLAAVVAGYLHGGQPPPVASPTYCDVAEWAGRRLRDPDLRTRAQGIADRLAGAARLVGGGGIVGGGSIVGGGGPSVQGHVFDHTEVAAVGALARCCGRTPAVAWLTLAQRALARTTGLDGLLMGVAAAGRDAPFTENVVGCLVNPLVIRGLAAAGDLPDAVRAAGAELDRASGAAQVPFAMIARRMQPDRTTAARRFPNVFIGYDEVPGLDLGPEVRTRYTPVVLRRAKYERTVSIEADGDRRVWCTVECLGVGDPAAELLRAMAREVADVAAVTV
jgi:condensation domain-containing protein